MDSCDAENDMLDLLAWNCSQLTAQLSDINSLDAKKKLLDEHIKRMDNDFDTINDFKEDLDWFNVTEPLTFKKSMKGKIVVLDFFTYCCINCMHILPDLKKLERKYSVEDGLVVVGVHSAKFDNEKDSTNILSAVQRYDITHPVVNDSFSSMWMDLHIKCWPTLLILGPRGNPLFVLMGEGHSKTLEEYIGAAINFYKERNLIEKHSLPMKPAADLLISSNLKFPGKIACSEAYNADEIKSNNAQSELYVVSDSGNHRILVLNANGKVIEKIGGKENGFVDGNFRDARFDSPQGVTFFDNDIIFVADTENHAIREINLKKKTVCTIAGHGEQGVDKIGGLIGKGQEISSPWDVVTYRTRDMDMSFHMDDEAILEKDIVLIAMAGTHQIWAIFKSETIWWKFKKFSSGAVAAIAGNGHEENRNNSYPQNAAFAQPSGLAISSKIKELYIADSESSCIRKLSLTDGKVLPVVGGDRNPLNLFAFGDIDGVQLAAKLQHPLGVAYNSKEHCLYVADTYNHKIKIIDLATNRASTCVFKDVTGTDYLFNEPGGLCVSPCGNILYVCNTNNHSIDVVNLTTLTVKSLQLQFNTTAQEQQFGERHNLPTSLKIQPTGAKISLEFTLKTQTDVKFTVEAPQKWKLKLSNDRWLAENPSGTILNGNVEKSTIESEQVSSNYTVNVDVKAPSLHDSQEQDSFLITFKTNLCAITKDICFPKIFTISVPIIYSLDGMDCIDEKINVTIGENELTIV